MKYKNIFAVVLCICILCTLSFSVYGVSIRDFCSYLPEPIVTDNCKTFVFIPSDSNTSASPTLFIFYADPNPDVEFEVYINISSEDRWQYTCIYTTPGSILGPVMLMYDAITGEYLGGNYNITWNNTYTTSRNITNWNSYMNYGCTPIFSSSYNVSLGTIQWGYAVQQDYLSYIVNTSLANILSELNDIENDVEANTYALGQLYNRFLNYSSWITNTYFREIQAQTALLGSIETYLSSISYQLNQLYILLGGGQQVPTVPPENDSFIDEYNSLENNLMTDYESDAAAVFSNANNISSFSNAIQFLSVSLQQIILNNAKLNTLILFTLGIGIAVLIIGRKINT